MVDNIKREERKWKKERNSEPPEEEKKREKIEHKSINKVGT